MAITFLSSQHSVTVGEGHRRQLMAAGEWLTWSSEAKPLFSSPDCCKITFLTGHSSASCSVFYRLIKLTKTKRQESYKGTHLEEGKSQQIGRRCERVTWMI